SNLDTDSLDRLLADHDSGQPLCLVICTWSPHIPWPENDGYDPQRIDIPPYLVDTPITRSARSRYYTDVTLLDARLGSCLDSLKQHDFEDNTMVVYISDHGAQWPFAKWNLYDAGIRVPMVIRWPGVVKQGQVTGALVSLVDLLPTLIEIAGGKIPDDIDGRSLVPVIKDGKDQHRTEIFATHTGDQNINEWPMRGVRTGRFKYIRNLQPDGVYDTHITLGKPVDGVDYWQSWQERAKTDPAAALLVNRYRHRPSEELYDLQNDPHELNNLAGEASYQRVKADLRERMESWRTRQGEETNSSKVKRQDEKDRDEKDRDQSD
ncbi:MAG: sulfatase-like hydrolase/transferase, partial [Planctomycetales bacterium]